MPERAARRYPWSCARRPGVHDARRRMRSEATAKPSSIRGTTVAVLDVGPPLQLVRALCDALEEQAVAYCHFKSNNEIARDLSLSPNTVANHVAGILAKLHVENRIQAAVEAVRSGIS